MKMKKLSVIIPMYNSSKFIEEAVKSVLVQKNIDIEVIVVDDGSTDNSCAKLAKYRNEICLFHKENGGASSARNFGLRNCSGDYVMFLDADDYIDDCTICSRCVGILENNALCDFCMFNLKHLNEETHEIKKNRGYPKRILSLSKSHEISKELLVSGHFPASPCFKIIRKEFLLKNHLFFMEGTIAEDVEWCVRLLIASKTFRVLKDDAYVYRKGINTSVTGILTKKKCIDLYDVIKRSVLDVNKVLDLDFRYTLLSAMAYEYCVLLGNVSIIKDEETLLKIKSLDYLLDYTLFPKMKYVSVLYRLFGFDFFVRILGFYISRFARSRV